ncbi:hypothetical protein O7608_01950 [Solwaraspora sp. WMMA2056]|uniref:hypothetical protein n=1 Tax=Solwaraspora sp. WMMA2056 TaxID=3015161 RepID=UPI00259B7A3E|nr:hypothetical protein [Solwaraspora sp. WMMA2056]WJK41238.1 hypothetical protein O7608_01950 [Solwaraspora sp. WMMA2056]
MDADLEWQLNHALSIGPWPVHVSTDASHARLRDLDTLEDLRDMHDWGPMFTLRFPDGTTRDVAVGRPDDDGSFTLIDADTAAAIEAAAASAQDSEGPLAEPADVATATAWLHDHGFVTRGYSRSGGISGSRLFERGDGWRARYSCVFGTWSLELSSPESSRFTSFHRLCRDKNATWRDALPTLIGDPPHTSTRLVQ